MKGAIRFLITHYSNEELLNRGDEISLAMLVNKIRCLEDVETFTRLSKEKVDEILKDTPVYLLDIIAKLARALFYNMDIPEDKTEEAVARIKERSMGRLFEGITYSYQDEINKIRAKGEEMEREMERVKEEMGREIEEARQKEEEADRRVREASKEIEEIKRESRILQHITKMLIQQYTVEEIKDSLKQEFHLSQEQVEEIYRKAMEP